MVEFSDLTDPFKKFFDNFHPGKSNAQVKPFTETSLYDPNRYEYGGRPGGADEMAGMLRNRGEGFNAAAHGMIGEAWQDRLQSDQSRGLGMQSRGLQLEARNRQAEAQNLMIDRARGRNLISTQVGNQARTDLGSRLTSMAASARGPAGLANAQNDAMAAQAQGLGQINQQQQTASMQEQLAAEQAAFGAASGMREGDTGMRAGDDQMRGLDITQRGQSLGAANSFGQLGLGYANAENAVRGQQMQGNIAQQQIAAGSKQSADQINTGVNQGNAAQDWNYLKMGLGAGMGAAQMGITAGSASGGGGGGTPPPTSDPLAKTGVFGLGQWSAGSGPAPATFDAIGPGGGMDVGGSLQAHSNFATRFVGDPSGGMVARGPFSDPRAKEGVAPLGFDWERHPQKSSLRDPKSFRRDSRAEQRAIGKAYDADLLRQADEQIAAYRSAVGAPPSWLTDYMEETSAKDRLLASAADDMRDEMRADYDQRMAMGPTISDPRAKADAFAMGAAYGASQATGQEVAPMPEEERPKYFGPDGRPLERYRVGKQEELIPPHIVEQMNDELARNAPDSPHPLPPPPPASRQMESFERDRPLAIQREQGGAPKSLGINLRSAARSRPDVGARVSDPRAKELGGVHDNEVAKTLDDVPAVSYKYKDPSFEPNAQRPGERQVGFLTSDLKRSPLGASVVEERPDGYEGYNQHRMIGLQYAEIRNLHERLRDLEANQVDQQRPAELVGLAIGPRNRKPEPSTLTIDRSKQRRVA